MLTGSVEPRMPFGQDPLPEDQIDLFRNWINQGAKDDTPASARGPQVPTEPPTYAQPPVVTAAAYSPDGKILAVGGYREILLHEADGSKIEARLLGRSDRIHNVAFTPDGKQLVAVGGHARALRRDPSLGPRFEETDPIRHGDNRHPLRR